MKPEPHDVLCGYRPEVEGLNDPDAALVIYPCTCPLLSRARAHERSRVLRKLAWSCADCGNTYGPDVHECPNTLLDDAGAEEKRDLLSDERRSAAERVLRLPDVDADIWDEEPERDNPHVLVRRVDAAAAVLGEEGQ